MLRNLPRSPIAHRGSKTIFLSASNYSAVSLGFPVWTEFWERSTCLVHHGVPEPQSSQAPGRGSGKTCRMNRSLCLGSDPHYQLSELESQIMSLSLSFLIYNNPLLPHRITILYCLIGRTHERVGRYCDHHSRHRKS